MGLTIDSDLIENDKVEFSEDSDGNLTITHKTSGGQMKYDSGSDQWDLPAASIEELNNADIANAPENSLLRVTSPGVIDTYDGVVWEVIDDNAGSGDYDVSDYNVVYFYTASYIFSGTSSTQTQVSIRFNGDNGDNYDYTERSGANLSSVTGDDAFRWQTDDGHHAKTHPLGVLIVRRSGDGGDNIGEEHPHIGVYPDGICHSGYGPIDGMWNRDVDENIHTLNISMNDSRGSILLGGVTI